MNAKPKTKTNALRKLDIYKDGKMLPAPAVAKKFISKTNLQHSFIMAGDLWVYVPDKGIYVRFQERQLMAYLVNTIDDLGSLDYTSKSYLYSLAWFITTKRPHNQKINYDYITFRNGHYNFKTRALEPLNPDVISISYIDTPYNPDGKPEQFLEFLRSQFEEDVITFLQATLSSILRADNRAQVFFYFYGPGGTGKSTLINIISLLVGEEATVTTTLRDLNTDKFEGSNLLGKRLIVINDTEGFKGDLQILKAITGGDSVQGRTKFEQGSFEVRPRGFVVISGNQPLLTKDTSGALARRIRLISMKNKPNKVQDLLYKEDNVWKGPMVDEMSGIVNWALDDMPKDRATELLRDINLTPGLVEDHKTAVSVMNPLMNWVTEELQVAEGSYLGYTTKQTPEALLHSVRQLRTLYPCYLLYCKRSGSKPLGLKTFTSDLLNTCEMMGVKVFKKRKEHGMFISGLGIKPHVLQADYQAGAPMTSLEGASGSNPQEEAKGPQKVLYMDFEQGPDEVDHKLYEAYQKALGKTNLKVHLNKAGKTFNPSPDALVDEHTSFLTGLKGVEVSGKQPLNPSLDYRNHLRGLMVKGITKINTSVVPYNYKPMGLSPRILPVNYGDSFNSVKRFLRSKAYTHVCPQGYVILDIDLKSCYTSILLGLLPLELFSIRKAVDKGLWKHLESEFQQSNRKALFNKPAVKICTYSSLFGGGPNAMINGMLEFMQKDMGMRPEEFRKCEMYEPCHTLARSVAEFMNTTDVVTDFREISNYFKLTYDGKTIVGPTGHRYKVDENLFRSSYPNFLQSYEFYLLAKSTLEALSSFPEAELIGHFHDGNVVLVKEPQAEGFVASVNKSLENLRQDLRLAYPQTIEWVAYKNELC